ncbi:hypothetical protein ACFLV4_03980 [Chloroflexota bacterium]
MATARLLTEAWLIHYNFFKEHETLGNIPPAVKMGATPIKDWAEVVSETKVITSPEDILPSSLTGGMPQPHSQVKRKIKRPKRKPKDLKLKPRVELSLIQMRRK